jgi:hypothetical protein
MEKNLLTICSKCERIKVDGQWFDRDSYSDYDNLIKIHNLSYGYCPKCVEFFREEYKKLKQMYGALRN